MCQFDLVTFFFRLFSFSLIVRFFTITLESDILEWVNSIHLGEEHYIHDIWINPKIGDDVWRCPWLRKLPKQNKYICRIQDVKPEHCRKYPKSKEHAEETGCRGFE